LAHFFGGDGVENVIDRIKELSDMGFTQAIFNMPDVCKITLIEIFVKKIIPAVADL
jgi:hypothetical protein